MTTGVIVSIIAFLLIIICMDIIDPHGTLFQVEEPEDDDDID